MSRGVISNKVSSKTQFFVNKLQSLESITTRIAHTRSKSSAPLTKSGPDLRPHGEPHQLFHLKQSCWFWFDKARSWPLYGHVLPNTGQLVWWKEGIYVSMCACDDALCVEWYKQREPEDKCGFYLFIIFFFWVRTDFWCFISSTAALKHLFTGSD